MLSWLKGGIAALSTPHVLLITFWQQNEISTVMCSSWAHTRNAIECLPCPPRSAAGRAGAGAGLRWGSSVSSGETRPCAPSSTAPTSPSPLGLLFAAEQQQWGVPCRGVRHLRVWGNCPFQANPRGDCTLGRRERTLVRAPACFHQPWSSLIKPRLLPPAWGQAERGQWLAGWGRVGGGDHDQIGPCPCQVHTRDVTSGGRPRPVTAHGNYSPARPGEGRRDFLA